MHHHIRRVIAEREERAAITGITRISPVEEWREMTCRSRPTQNFLFKRDLGINVVCENGAGTTRKQREVDLSNSSKIGGLDLFPESQLHPGLEASIGLF